MVPQIDMLDRLWFDVEEGYNTTVTQVVGVHPKLWFDVEEGYNTTPSWRKICSKALWFDVEEGYNTTVKNKLTPQKGCGLM